MGVDEGTPRHAWRSAPAAWAASSAMAMSHELRHGREPDGDAGGRREKERGEVEEKQKKSVVHIGAELGGGEAE